MSKTYRPYEPDQILLLPPSVKDWLPAGHLAHFVADIAEKLNLRAITGVYEREERGHPPYHPVMMVKVLIYAYCVGLASSRRIERGLVEDVALRYLAANNTPDFRTISDFRMRHLEALQGLFVQVLRLCQKAGMVKLGHVALDGTKMKANASKHKAMSYGRMKKTEAQLQAEVAELLRRAGEIDEAEDAEYGRDKRGDELPAELAHREGRLKKIQEAMEELEREAREEAEAKKRENEAKQVAKGPGGRKPSEPDPTPKDKAQKNFTDPDSRIMPRPGDRLAFIQAYNCQAAVDGKEQMIVAADVAQQTNDSREAEPMLKQVKANVGAVPRKASMDAGYFGKDNVAALEKLGVEAFIPPERRKHGEIAPPAPRGRIPKGLSAKELMRRKLSTIRGRTIYAKRKTIVEPVFGQIKQARGFRQFLLRGIAKVKGEWSLICTTHNLLKLWRNTAFQAA
ncbi:MAG: IS1182 family transposase [Elusimicrobia bacterium]|nr:IS1182 family transposase [Elusimicrobiota bacterium]